MVEKTKKTSTPGPAESPAGKVIGGANTMPQPAPVAGQLVPVTGGLILTPRPFTLTMPPPDDFYFVREDQLDGLTHVTIDYSLEIALAAGGAAFGFAQNLIAVIKSLSYGQTPEISDLLLAAVALCLGVLAVTKFLQFKSAMKSVETLKSRIKSGQKAIVSHGQENQAPL
jgi:hypothetical protein